MQPRMMKKDKKESRSVQRKGLKKNQIDQLFLKNCREEEMSKEHEQSLRKKRNFEKIIDRSKAKSSLGIYSHDERRNSADLIVPNRRVSLSGWIDQQVKNGAVQKRSRANYEYLHVIGKGGFGKVYKVRDKRTSVFFAMKEMSKALILAKKSNDSVLNERNLLTTLNHKFIVNMRHAFQDRESLYLIMDLMPGGDLRYHICRKHKFTEEQTRFFSACIFMALEYLHSRKIMHRDLKPENLVLDAKGYIHVTDLGIAKYLRQDNCGDTSGTPGYMAPQVMLKQNHSYEVDYYALGVILYELMMGKRPYTGRDRRQIRQQILAKQTVIKKSEIPQGWSIEAADFVNKLLQRRPMMRLGWNGSHEVKNHAWLKDFPWESLVKEELASPFRNQSLYNPDIVRYQSTKEDEQMQNLVHENQLLLRKNSVQEIFDGYTFEEQTKLQNHTTSSQLCRNRAEAA